MKITNLILPAAIIGVAYYFYQKNNNSNDISNIPYVASAIGNTVPQKASESLFVKNPVTEAIRTSGTTPTPTIKPSFLREKTTSNIAKITGIKEVTNTMGVTAEVSKALKGTISPLTGKVRI